MKLYFRPQTRIGLWSVRFAVGFIVIFLLTTTSVALFHVTGGNTLMDNLGIGIPMVVALSSGLAAFICGVISHFFYNEPSFLAIISTVLGLIVAIFFLGEVLFAH